MDEAEIKYLSDQWLAMRSNGNLIEKARDIYVSLHFKGDTVRGGV